MKIPKKITIVRHEYPDAQALVREIIRVSRKGDQEGNILPTDFLITGKPLEELLAIITYIWRIQDRIVDKHNKEPKESLATEEIKKLCKYTEQIIEKLKAIGFEIKDRAGEPFNYGLLENVVATKPRPGINQEIIIETLLPTVFFREQTIQRGDIIIETPESLPSNE